MCEDSRVKYRGNIIYLILEGQMGVYLIKQLGQGRRLVFLEKDSEIDVRVGDLLGSIFTRYVFEEGRVGWREELIYGEVELRFQLIFQLVLELGWFKSRWGLGFCVFLGVSQQFWLVVRRGQFGRGGFLLYRVVFRDGGSCELLVVNGFSLVWLYNFQGLL